MTFQRFYRIVYWLGLFLALTIAPVLLVWAAIEVYG